MVGLLRARLVPGGGSEDWQVTEQHWDVSEAVSHDPGHVSLVAHMSPPSWEQVWVGVWQEGSEEQSAVSEQSVRPSQSLSRESVQSSVVGELFGVQWPQVPEVQVSVPTEQMP